MRQVDETNAFDVQQARENLHERIDAALEQGEHTSRSAAELASVINSERTDEGMVNIARIRERLRRQHDHAFDVWFDSLRGAEERSFAIALAEREGMEPLASLVDDVMMPDNLAQKLRFLDEHPGVGLVHSNVRQIDALSGDAVDLLDLAGRGPVRLS